VRRPGRADGGAGQGLVEYGLILALTSVFTAVILGVFGGTMAEFLSIVGSAIDAATGG
jgi:Flp pilus assembly pilin Flp